MLGSLNSFLFSKPVNGGLTILNNPESNVGLVFKDLFGSTGRIYQEYDRNKHGGRESLIEELLTTGVWGAGIPLGKKAVDWFGKTTASGSIKAPNMDLQLLQESNPQRLTPEAIEKYIVPDQFENGSKKMADAAARKAESEALQGHLKQLAKNTTKEVTQDAKTLLLRNRAFQSFKVIGVGALTAAALGAGVPKLNQYITRQMLNKEQQKKQEASSDSKVEQPAPFGKGQPSQFGAFANNPFQAMKQAQMNPQMNRQFGFAPFGGGNRFTQNSYFAYGNSYQSQARFKGQNAGKSGQVQFGGVGEGFAAALQKLSQNDQLSTLAFSDLPLSGGRVIMTRNQDEFLEKLWKEGGIIATLFFIMPKAERWFAGNRKDIGFNSMKLLNDKYKGKADAFLNEYAALHTHLKNKFDGKGNTLAELFDEAKRPEQVTKVVDNIRKHFNIAEQGEKTPNMLYAMAEEGGKIPTLAIKREGVQKPLKHIDITRQIDLDGVKSIAGFLDNLAAGAKKDGSKVFQQELTKQVAKKAAAFGGATMVGFGLMSYFIPKVQHWITYKRTGRDFFPGVE